MNWFIRVLSVTLPILVLMEGNLLATRFHLRRGTLMNIARAAVAVYTSVLISMLAPTIGRCAEWELDKGAVELGGGIAFSHMSGSLYEDEHGNGLTYFAFSPEIRYFLSPGIGVGGRIGIANLSQGDLELNELNLGPVASYYFADESRSYWPFVSLGVFYTNSSFDDGYDSATVSGLKVHMAVGGAVVLPGNAALKLGVFLDADRGRGDWRGAKVESGYTAGVAVGFAGFLF